MKICNNRPVLFVAISLVCGILLGFAFVVNFVLAIILSCLVGTLILFTVFLVIFRRKFHNQIISGLSGFAVRCFKTFLGISIALAVGISSFFISCASFDNTTEVSGRHIASGYIHSIGLTEDGTTVIILDDVKVLTESGEKLLKGKTYLRVNGGNSFDNRLAVGSNITVMSEISNRSILSGSKIYGYYYKHNIKYTAECSSFDIISNNFDIKFLDGIREDVYKLLEKNMSHSAGIAYAMLMGDTTKVMDSRLETFRESGIAHIFAVSGLHVGFVVVMLTFVLTKLRANRRTQLLIVTILLAVYCTFCGFSPSMVRASIMSITCLAARCFGRQYDGLTAISASAILILFFKPLYIFDVGMQLSYFCILSLLVLAPRFKQLFSALFKNRESGIAGKLIDGLSMSLAVNVGTLPIVLSCFGKFAVIGILFNVVAIPVVSVLFMLLVILTLVSVIIPPISSVLIVADYLFYAFEYPFYLITSSVNLSLSLKSFGSFAVTYYGVIVCAGDYLFIGKRKRVIVCSLLAAITVIGVVFI